MEKEEKMFLVGVRWMEKGRDEEMLLVSRARLNTQSLSPCFV